MIHVGLLLSAYMLSPLIILTLVKRCKIKDVERNFKLSTRIIEARQLPVTRNTGKKYLQSVLRFRQVDSSPKVKVGHQLTGMTGAKPCKTAKELKML